MTSQMGGAEREAKSTCDVERCESVAIAVSQS